MIFRYPLHPLLQHSQLMFSHIAQVRILKAGLFRAAVDGNSDSQRSAVGAISESRPSK